MHIQGSEVIVQMGWANISSTERNLSYVSLSSSQPPSSAWRAKNNMRGEAENVDPESGALKWSETVLLGGCQPGTNM